MTHDSIGLGEDGPTHQPIEHLAALRAIPIYACGGLVTPLRPPNVGVYPCCAIRLLCWRYPDKNYRQSVPANNPCAVRGAYPLAGAGDSSHLTLAASGSEVALALAARDILAQENINAAVVSVRLWNYFTNRMKNGGDNVISPQAPLLVIEAASPMAWRLPDSPLVIINVWNFRHLSAR